VRTQVEMANKIKWAYCLFLINHRDKGSMLPQDTCILSLPILYIIVNNYLPLSSVSFILGLPKVCLLFFYLKSSVLLIFVIVACHMFVEIPLDMCCVIMCFKFGHQLIKMAVTLKSE
jgi:hypothetical protein